jgi:predicted amidophosphoribosyltransferase
MNLGASLWQAALTLLYPPRCAGCDALLDGNHACFCRACALTLVPLERACPRCARPLATSVERPAPCLACLMRPPRFARALAPFEYGGAVAQAIKRMKWTRLPQLAWGLGELLARELARAPPPFATPNVIVPVPLHPRRLRAREFNQAAALAFALKRAAEARQRRAYQRARELGCDEMRARSWARITDGLMHARVEPEVLARVRDTPPQTGLGAAERRRNVHAAFIVRKPAKVRDRMVLLVDDVMTTGATADACAAALQRAGAASVVVLTLGRAVT